MPQTRALVLKAINHIMSEMAWENEGFPSDDPIDSRIQWILNKESIHNLSVTIAVAVWLHHRFSGVHPEDIDVIRIITSRKVSEREEDVVEEQAIFARIDRLLGINTGILARYRVGQLMLGDSVRTDIDETPLRTKTVISVLADDVSASELTGLALLQQTQEILRVRVHSERQSVRLCVGIWLYKRLSGSWPMRESILRIFSRMDPKLIDQLLEIGTLRIRGRQIAVSKRIDPTRIP